MKKKPRARPIAGNTYIAGIPQPLDDCRLDGVKAVILLGFSFLLSESAFLIGPSHRRLRQQNRKKKVRVTKQLKHQPSTQRRLQKTLVPTEHHAAKPLCLGRDVEKRTSSLRRHPLERNLKYDRIKALNTLSVSEKGNTQNCEDRKNANSQRKFRFVCHMYRMVVCGRCFAQIAAFCRWIAQRTLLTPLSRSRAFERCDRSGYRSNFVAISCHVHKIYTDDIYISYASCVSP